MTNLKGAGSRKKRARKDEGTHKAQELCCCPPQARIWGSNRSHCCVVENEMQHQSRLMARADSNASVLPPDRNNADGSGGSQVDSGTLKGMAALVKVDEFTINWSAEGQCKPLSVELSVRGLVQFHQDCLEESGQIVLSHWTGLEWPDVNTRNRASVSATLTVRDCAGNEVTCDLELLEA